MEDLAAVMATAGSDRAVLLGISEGGPMSILFAAEHPEAVEALVLYGTAACFYRDADYPAGWQPQVAERLADRLYEHWGTGVLLRIFAPSCAGDPLSRELFGRFHAPARARRWAGPPSRRCATSTCGRCCPRCGPRRSSSIAVGTG